MFAGARQSEVDCRVPKGAKKRHSIPVVPNAASDHSIRPNDASHLADAGGRVVHKVHDQLGQDGVKVAVCGWQRLGVRDEDLRARNSAAVAWALSRLWETQGRERVESLAAQLGCSRRYLHARFREQVGLPPKSVARLIRFGAVRRRIERTPSRWADIAHECGYADQSHLNRDFRELAGTTPSDFITRLLPGYGGVLGDGISFVQD